MNFPSQSLPSVLRDVPCHINPEVNPAVGRSFGINVPPYYLVGPNLFTEMHVEDAYLDSCNVVHWGEADAKKLWLCINP